MRRFVNYCLLLFGLYLSGCGDLPNASTADGGLSTTSASTVTGRVSPAGVTVSVDASSNSGFPFDGGNADDERPDDRLQAVLIELRTMKRQSLLPALQATPHVRRDRAMKVVDLAAKALQMTVDNPLRKSQFQEAITCFLEARLQLAIDGSNVEVDQLYADVQVLNARDPESDAAAEGIYSLARFAQAKALSSGQNNPMWFENFSRWAREFAHRFPEQEGRAVKLLLAAGRSCELNSMAEGSNNDSQKLQSEAKLCYTSLVEQFSQTSQGQEAAAVLRRLALPGQKISQFSGPTLDGSYLTADDFLGRVSLVYFWEVASDQFSNKMLPLLKRAAITSGGRLRFVGVNLDEDEAAVRHFVNVKELPGRQVFFEDQNQRSWNSPLIQFWGLSTSPSVWLINRDGVVNAVDLTAMRLAEHVDSLCD